MIKKLTKAIVFCLFNVALLLQFQSCYSTVQDSTKKESNRSADSLAPGECIIEGVVHDFEKQEPIQESEFDIPSDTPRVFILDNYFWVTETPPYSIKHIFLEGIDMSYLNKYVRIKGVIQNAPSGYYVNIQNPLNIRLYVSKVEYIK
ncbi:MAG: hypothetical protein Q8933_13395 [Bacteroidota bacterium]|nr:hypothetical protein [Bacteroidota bacterium]